MTNAKTSNQPTWPNSSLKRFGRLLGGSGFPVDEQGFSETEMEIPFFKVKDLAGPLKLTETNNYISKETATRLGATIFPESAIVFAKVGAALLLNRFRVLGCEGCLDNNMMALLLKKPHNVSFFLHLLNNSDLSSNFNQGPVPSVNTRQVGALQVTVPPLPEQQRIAAYLDASCAAIDAAVAAKRRQLETLDALRKEAITRAITRGLKSSTRTKPSGHDWLGEIATHWSAPCLKRLLSEPLTYGLNEAAELEDRDLPRYLRITDFDDDGKLREDTFRSLPREVACEALLKPNDVLFARSGATVGKTFLFRNYEGEACFAGYLIRARTLPWKLDPVFLYLFTKSTAYESWKNLIFTQATIQNISAVKYNYLAIPLPPLNEQRAIVAHVEEKTAEFRSMLLGLETQIATLTAYRKSLIHECVTGQRRITEARL